MARGSSHDKRSPETEADTAFRACFRDLLLPEEPHPPVVQQPLQAILTMDQVLKHVTL